MTVPARGSAAVAAGLALLLAAVATPPAGARAPVIRTAAGSLGSGDPRTVSHVVGSLAVSGSAVYAGDLVYSVVRALDTAGRRTWVAAGTGNSTVHPTGGSPARTSVGSPTALAGVPGGFLVAGGGYVQRVAGGRVTVVAGGGSVTGPLVEGAAARDVRLARVHGLAAGPDGTVYATDTAGHRVLGFGPDGKARVVAGTGVAGHAGLGGPARTLSLDQPYGLAVTPAGDLLVADTGNNRVVRIDRLGLSHPFVGLGPEPGTGGDGGQGALAQLSAPSHLAVLPSGDVYVSEDGRIRRVRPDGTVSTLHRDATGAIATAPNGDVFYARDRTVKVRRANGAVATLAGLPAGAMSGFDALGGGVPGRLQTHHPNGVAVHRGTLYWTDDDDKAWRLRAGRAAVVTADTEPYFDPIAGARDEGRGVLLGSTAAVAVAPSGRVYVTARDIGQVYRLDGYARRLVAGRKHLCLPGTNDDVGDGGPATEATLCNPLGIAAVGSALYIADTGHHRIRVVAGGRIRTVAGTGTGGFAGDSGRATAAALAEPQDVAVGPDGTLYVADTGNHVIRRIGRDGVIRTLAGTPGQDGYSGDGGSARAARLNSPGGVAVGPDGAVYVADTGNHVIRRIDARGVVTTFAGNGRDEFSGDGGAARTAGLGCPSDLTFDDTAPRLYVADRCNTRVRVISF